MHDRHVKLHLPILGEAGWRTLVEQVKDYAIFMLDTEPRNISWNEGVERVFGYAEAEFVGQSASDIFTPEDRAAGEVEREFGEAAATGRASDDRWLVRKDGQRFWASGITTALRGPAGELIGYAKVLRDQTAEKRYQEERRRAETQLRESEHRLLTALTAARMGTWTLDLLEHRTRFDDGLHCLFGTRPDDVHTLEDLVARVHPDDRDAVAGAFRHALETGAELEVEFRVVRPDGSVRWLRNHGRVLFDDGGDPLEMTGACMDITEWRRAEEQLQQAQRIDAVGRLAGGVAHEVNNMMTAILGFSDLLLDTVPAGDPRRGDMLQIRKAAARAAMVTAQLLAFSRRQMLQPRVLDLNEVVTDLQPMLARLLGEDKRLEHALDSHLWPVHADRGQLEQVVVNLALNARDAMPRGGRLVLETGNVVLDDAYVARHPGVAIPRGEYARLVVSDTGSGIVPEVQHRIFEPFFTTKPVGQGTGLGLSMVYGIVKQSGGFVWVYSEPGQGTVFKVYLPRAQMEGVAREVLPRGAAPRGAERILVVEDDDLLRTLTARLLEAQGYGVVPARDGEEALEHIRVYGEAIDLVLSDVVLPALGGIEFEQRIQSLAPRLPILFMSGFTDQDILRRGLLAPGTPYLQKPFDAETLGRRVRETLTSRRA